MPDSSTDVAVIGGGAVGASTLFHLADHHGVTGVLFEKAQLGAGSTSKAAGGVRNTFTSRANAAAGNRAIRYFQNFEDNVDRRLEFRQNGYMYLFHSDAAAERWNERAELFRSYGAGAELLSPEAAARRFPALDASSVSGALFGTDCGHVDPHALTQGFADAAVDRGATVHTGTAVTDVVVEAGAVTAVESDAGRYEVDAVVNAAGPWAGRIGAMVGVDVPIDLLIRRIMVTSSHPDAAGPLVLDPELGCYFSAERDGSLLVCDTGEDIHEIDDPDAASDRRLGYDYYRETTETVSDLVPDLPELEVRSGWSGLQSHTPDGHALVGPTEVEGFYLACGLSGHGVQQSPCVGAAVADLAVTGRTDWLDTEPFSPDRFSDAEPAAAEEMA